MYKTIAEIGGMSCGMCEAHVNNVIRKSFPGCKVKTSARKNLTKITYKTEITSEMLKEALAPTGYSVGKVTCE